MLVRAFLTAQREKVSRGALHDDRCAGENAKSCTREKSTRDSLELDGRAEHMQPAELIARCSLNCACSLMCPHLDCGGWRRAGAHVPRRREHALAAWVLTPHSACKPPRSLVDGVLVAAACTAWSGYVAYTTWACWAHESSLLPCSTSSTIVSNPQHGREQRYEEHE